MEKGFENKPSESKKVNPDAETIKIIKRSIAKIEEELAKNDNTPDDILNFEKSLTDLKAKVALLGGVKIEDRIENYSPSLEQVVYQRNLDEFYKEIMDIHDQSVKTILDRGVIDYFEKQDEVLELESEIAIIASEIEKGLDAKSEISKDKLNEMISKLKSYKEALSRKQEYVSRRSNNDVNVPKTIDDIEEAKKRINKVIEKIKRLEDDFKNYGEEKYDSPPSLN
jgi:DNA repair exonuclease SbcCD ATPase subunit